MECPACKELLSSNYDLVSVSADARSAASEFFLDVYDESFQPARTQSPQPHGDSARNMRRRKVLAYFLMLWEWLMMAYGIPFNGDFNPQNADRHVCRLRFSLSSAFLYVAGYVNKSLY